jgi:hypothetical protein
VYIAAGAGVSAALVARICAEADAIWRPGGVTFSWRRVARAAAPDRRGGDGDQSAPGTLTLNIGDDPGVVRSHGLPLGWIVFDTATSPQQEIYLSHANALAMLDDSRPVVGIVEQMPIAQREMLLARALGRALAHELGHYLLASKAHTPRGLMKAMLTAVELFGSDDRALRLEPAQRRAVVARLRGEPLLAAIDPS